MINPPSQPTLSTHPFPTDTPELQAKEAEIARLKKMMSNLQGDLNDAEGRGTDAHEAARLRALFTETEKELFQLRKLKNDAQMLADYKKTCESLQREGNIQSNQYLPPSHNHVINPSPVLVPCLVSYRLSYLLPVSNPYPTFNSIRFFSSES